MGSCKGISPGGKEWAESRGCALKEGWVRHEILPSREGHRSTVRCWWELVAVGGPECWPRVGLDVSLGSLACATSTGAPVAPRLANSQLEEGCWARGGRRPRFASRFRVRGPGQESLSQTAWRPYGCDTAALSSTEFLVAQVRCGHWCSNSGMEFPATTICRQEWTKYAGSSTRMRSRPTRARGRKVAV